MVGKTCGNFMILAGNSSILDLTTLSNCRMDENGDGHLTEDEFLSGCLQDEELSKMLAPDVAQ